MNHFEPIDAHEHERGNAGEAVPDYCANCNHPFMDHYNGKCPQPAKAARRLARGA